VQDHKPLLRPIDLSEASRISPWPERLAGLKPWSKPDTSKQEARAEYEHGWYAALEAKWSLFFHELADHQRHPGSVLCFFDKVRRDNNATMCCNEAVYGRVDVEEFLISAESRLYAADVNLMEVLWRSFIVERAAWAQSCYSFETIVEAGCGNGTNLFNLYLRLGLNSIAGCDLSPNVVKFLRRVAQDLSLNALFEAGDYCEMDIWRRMAPASKNWAVLSVHAIEQTENLTADWFKNLVALQNPPVLGMHFEPLHWGDDDPFAVDCNRYAELNGYNKNFLNAVRDAETAGTVKIIRAEKRVLGHSAYNPTSVIMWIPA